MLTPIQLAELKDSLLRGDILSTTDHVFGHLQYSSVRLSFSSEPIVFFPGFPIKLRPPNAIFGEPIDPNALEGINKPTEIEVPPLQLYLLSQGRIIGNDIALDSNQSIYCTKGLVGSLECWNQLSSECNESHHHGVLPYIHSDNRLLVFHKYQNQTGSLPGRSIFIPNLEPGNFGSFLIRVLPAMEFAAMTSYTFCRIIVADRTPWLMEVLDAFGWSNVPVFRADEVAGVSFEELLFPCAYAQEGLWNPYLFRSLQARLHKWASKDLPASLSSKIFVSRALGHRARPQYRPLLNEDELIQIAQNQNFTVLYPETLSFRTQINFFAHASQVAGASGSGMLNAMFAMSPARVCDLESLHSTVRQHAKLYDSTGKIYSFCFGKHSPHDQTLPRFRRAWSVSLDDFSRAMDWIDDQS